MKCPHCQTELVRTTKGGTPMLRTKGLLIKSGSLVAICPNHKCKGDVPVSTEVMTTLHQVSVLFFQREREPEVRAAVVVTG